MNIKHLEYIVKVMETGSLTKAASLLEVSQPSLTKAISSLEEEYGVVILTRKARGVEFTKEGVDFVLYAKGVLAAANAFPKKNCVVNKARLFVAAQQLDFIYTTMLETYHSLNNENLFFNLIETDRSTVVEHVLKGNVDVGFAIRTTGDAFSLPWKEEAHRLEITVMDRADCYVAVGPKSSFWNRSSVSFEELTNQMNIALDMEEESKQSFWLDQGQYKNLNNNRIVYVNTVNACETFLLNTESISYCSFWTRGCFKNPSIHIIPVEGGGFKQELLMLQRRGEFLTDVEERFVTGVYHRLRAGNAENWNEN